MMTGNMRRLLEKVTALENEIGILRQKEDDHTEAINRDLKRLREDIASTGERVQKRYLQSMRNDEIMWKDMIISYPS